MYASERYRSIIERVVGKGRASVVDLAGGFRQTRPLQQHLDGLRQGLVDFGIGTHHSALLIKAQ